MIVEPTAEEINLDDMKVRAPDLNLSCNEVHLHFFHDSRVVNGFEERDFDHHCDLLKFRKNFVVGICSRHPKNLKILKILILKFLNKKIKSFIKK